MIREHSEQINQRFNLTNIQFDKHGSTKIAIKAVFGEEFLKTRTLGCGYHLECSADKHKKHFNSTDVDLFFVLVNSLKNSVTEDEYYREKKRLINLILIESSK